MVLLVAGVLDIDPASAQISYRGGFERQVNRYRWTVGGEALQTIGAWRTQATSLFQSDAFILFDDRLSFRDEHRFAFLGERPIGEKTAFRLEGESGWYSLSRVLAQHLYAGVTLQGPRGLRVQPLAGFALDRRPGATQSGGSVPLRTDIGPAFGFRFTLPRTLVSEYGIAVAGDGIYQVLQPRRSTGARLSAEADRSFERTRVRTSVHLASVRRDAYQSASFLNREEFATRLAETVESTRSDTVDASLTVTAPVSRSLVISGTAGLSANRRAVQSLRAPEDALLFDSEFSRQAFDGQMTARYRRGSTELDAMVQAGAETERRTLSNENELPPAQAAQKSALLRQADYDRAYLTLQTGARIPVGRRMRLLADLSANSIRHDTPIINPDDRDEVFFSGRAGLLLRVTSALEMDLQVRASTYHTVYLKSVRSAENNKQKSLRFRPSLKWNPDPRTRFEFASEVRATYTVDDFVLPGRRSSDQSARELRYETEFEREVGFGGRLRLSGSYSDLRLGRFINDSFAEIPFDTLRTYAAWGRLTTGGKITAEIGVRAFIRTDYERSAFVRYERVGPDGEPLVNADGTPETSSVSRPGKGRILQLGPTTAIVWPMRRDAFLRLDGWLTVQQVTKTLYGTLPDGQMDAIRAAAREGERSIIPNLALTLFWNF